VANHAAIADKFIKIRVGVAESVCAVRTSNFIQTVASARAPCHSFHPNLLSTNWGQSNAGV